VLILTTPAGAAPADFPMQTGEMAVTCFGGPYAPGTPNLVLDTKAFVVAVVDGRVPPVGSNPYPTAGAHWYPPDFHNEFTPTTLQDIWSAENLGQVFGLALDEASPPNIYVTATTAFGDYTGPSYAWPQGGFGPAGYAGVYRLDGTTGDITALTTTVPNGSGGIGTNQIPNEGAGLGNIAYDAVHRQLFVTNLEDGKIYRLDTTGIIQSIHDPFAPDSGAAGFAPLGERLWGVQVHAGRLYYSVWLRDGGRPTTPWNPNAGPAPANPNNSIWSIAIDAGSGDFTGPDTLEFAVPYLTPNPGYSNPVADIAFSLSGKMVLAEKTMNTDFGLLDLGHGARVLEFTYSGSWNPSGNEYHIGSTFNGAANMYANSSGGTDYDCDDGVWSSGDTLIWGPTAYGFQRVPPGGNTVSTPTSTSWIIDGGLGKAAFGDVEVYRSECVVTQSCSVADDRLSCNGECSDPDLQCHPREILADSEGRLLEVTCCDCDPSGCQLQIDPASLQFYCSQNPGCPDPAVSDCRLVGHGNADGTISYSCDCVNPEQPPECTYVEECNDSCPGTCVKRCSGVCPDATQVCMPKVITETVPHTGDFTVTECDCDQPTSDLCRPVITADGTVECFGVCSNGEKCELVTNPAPDGVGLEYTCEPCSSNDAIGACCYTGPQGVPTCTETTQADCEVNLMGLYYGDGTTCAVHGEQCFNIGNEIGACCYLDRPSGVWYCTETSKDVCTNGLGGTYQGPFTVCTDGLCPRNQPEGACCYQDIAGNWQCTLATANECETQLFGMYHGDGTDCDPNPCPQDDTCDCTGTCDDRTPTYDDPAYAAFTDEVAVATEFADLGTDPVVVNIDIKNRVTAPLNANWTARTNTRYSHPAWTRDNLGTVFGLALDRRGNTYVTATTTYALDAVGALAGATPGSVIKIDATTGNPTVFANLPNTGPALGNICYDGANDQFFVSNFEDGRIYRLSSTGACLGTFDHATGTISASCAPEAGDAPGFVPLGERPWGLQVYNGRLYYGIWAEDSGRQSLTDANTIQSIALAGGNFSGAPSLEITLPGYPSYSYITSMPPADISFSETGCMLVAERGMYSDDYPNPHAARVLEYRQAVSGTWWPSTYTFSIGAFAGSNAAGGVDYDREGNIWATGDALQFSPLTVYGLQSLPCTGGAVSDSVLVDLNGSYTTLDKTEIGDVEIGCADHCVAPPKRMTAWFPLDEPAAATTAEEIVWDRDGTFTGTTTIPGMVAAARRFNGVGDFIRVPNAAQHNFGTGDFSLDAWVRTRTDSGLEVMLDKRMQPTRGWSLYVYNGQLGFQLGDGAGFTNWNRPGSIADGIWHHVAVTVDRNNPAGLIMYVDGVGTTYDPTAHMGSVSTKSDLWIGARDPAFGQIFYTGDLDEIELFRRALSAAEVQGLYRAGRSGKCKDRCILPRRVSLCRNKNTVNVNFTICNDSPVAHNYLYIFYGNNNCSWSGPTSFLPFIGIVNVPGNSCVTTPITVARPAGMPPGYEACFNVNVYNLDTGHVFGCEGSIYSSYRWCFIIIHGGPIGVPIGGPKSVGFDVTNEGDSSAVLNYTIVAEPADMDTDGAALSLDGLPPGEPVTGQALIAPGVDRHIELSLEFVRFEPFRHYDVVVYAEDSTTRALEVVGSFTAYAELTCGDLDRDGTISPADATLFEQCIAGPGMAPAGLCPENVDADCDDDNDVDLQDFAHLQDVLGTVLYTP